MDILDKIILDCILVMNEGNLVFIRNRYMWPIGSKFECKRAKLYPKFSLPDKLIDRRRREDLLVSNFNLMESVSHG